MKKFIEKYLYITMLILSTVGLSVAGFILMPENGEEYGERPVLAAVAINEIEQYLEGPLPEVAEEDFETDPSREDEGEGPVDATEEGVDELSGEEPGEDSLSDEAGEDDEEDEDDEDDAEFEADMAKIDEAIRQKKERMKEKKKRNRSDDDEDSEGEDTSEKSGEKKDEGPEYDFIVVGDDYFDDALFIGDSRQQGFLKYSGMDNIFGIADRGYQIYDTATKAVDTPLGKLTVFDALAVTQHKFKKVYIMFGVNEMTGGADHEEMTKYYYRLIHEVKRMQPDAIIYLEGVHHVTKSLSDSRPSISNTRINEKNEILKRVAKDENIVFLDLNEIPEFTDADGALVPQASDDGVHLHSGYVLLIKDYLYRHAIAYNGGEDNYSYVELSTLQKQYKQKSDEYFAKKDPDAQAEAARQQEEQLQQQQSQEAERDVEEKQPVMADN